MVQGGEGGESQGKAGEGRRGVGNGREGRKWRPHVCIFKFSVAYGNNKLFQRAIQCHSTSLRDCCL